ncbi:MAG: AraC family transcriptional regulator [Oscillospiraceae bacterium]|nr:AraC family transcriptional regulator [Oscillospiraceae bacterium]
MDWIRSFQRSVDYIEEHMTEPLEIGDIARVMNISGYYYQKIFNILCGFSVGEYIRNRRLALAGSELMTTRERVIDIALKYGYDTPEGFTRAFTRFHGATPSAVRRGSPVRSFAKIHVTITMKGGSTMDYKIVTKESFKVLEKAEEQSIEDDRNLNTIPQFWTRSHEDGTVKRLLELTVDRSYIFGICYGNSPSDKKTFDYSIAARVAEDFKEEDVPEGFRLSEIPARTWVVFECVGAMPGAVQELWHRIITEFFPSSPYKPTYEMDIEAYTEGNMSLDTYKSEIWVPVTVGD